MTSSGGLSRAKMQGPRVSNSLVGKMPHSKGPGIGARAAEVPPPQIMPDSAHISVNITLVEHTPIPLSDQHQTLIDSFYSKLIHFLAPLRDLGESFLAPTLTLRDGQSISAQELFCKKIAMEAGIATSLKSLSRLRKQLKKETETRKAFGVVGEIVSYLQNLKDLFTPKMVHDEYTDAIQVIAFMNELEKENLVKGYVLEDLGVEPVLLYQSEQVREKISKMFELKASVFLTLPADIDWLYDLALGLEGELAKMVRKDFESRNIPTP